MAPLDLSGVFHKYPKKLLITALGFVKRVNTHRLLSEPLSVCVLYINSLMTTYTVAVATYACDDGVAEWIRYNFTNVGDALLCIDQLDGYEEYKFSIHTEADVNDIPF